MEKIYGKLREEDLPILKSVIELFRGHDLQSGLHGTSLWNSKYKDVDLLVFSQSNDIASFKIALADLLDNHEAEILNQNGDEVCGLDYDIKIENMVLHLSFVMLL